MSFWARSLNRLGSKTVPSSSLLVLQQCFRFAPSIRIVHTRNFVSQFGYASLNYSLQKTEEINLEKSLLGGTKLLIGHSKSLYVFEYISDVLAVEELRLDSFTLGHYFEMPSSTEKSFIQSKWLSELEHIKRGSKKIDFITIAFLQSSTSDPNTNMNTFKEFKQIVLKSIDYKPSFGIHLSTELLTNITPQQLEGVLNDIEAMSRQDSIQILSCAVNPFTIHTAIPLLQQIRRSGQASNSNKKHLKILATDVLQTHPRRPGVLAPQTVPASSGGGIPRPVRGSGKGGIQQSLDKFKAALDHCLHVEKQYLDRLRDDRVDAKHVCWGHILTTAQDTILMPEEWAYLKHHQVDVQYDAAVKKLQSMSKQHADWEKLYTPLVRFLFSCFETVLQARKDEMLQATCERLAAVEAEGQPESSVSTAVGTREIRPVDLPRELAIRIGELGICDQIVLTGTEVLSDQWNEILSTAAPSSGPTKSEKELENDCIRAFEAVRAVLDQYSSAVR